MAAGARNGLCEKCLGNNVNLLIHNIDALLFLIRLCEHLGTEGEKSERRKSAASACVILCCWSCVLGNEIACDLFREELGEGHIAIECIDHVVAIVKRVCIRDIFIDAVGVRVARDIEPVPSPTLAVHR